MSWKKWMTKTPSQVIRPSPSAVVNCCQHTTHQMLLNYLAPRQWSYSSSLGRARNIPSARNISCYSCRMHLCSVILVGGHGEQSFFTFPTPLRFLQREPQAWISSHGYLINSNSCVQYRLFYSWKGKRNPFPPTDHSISFISEDEQDCNTFVHIREDFAL